MSTAGVGYTGEWADRHFGGDRSARNEFFRKLGAAPCAGQAAREALPLKGRRESPGAFLDALGLG